MDSFETLRAKKEISISSSCNNDIIREMKKLSVDEVESVIAAVKDESDIQRLAKKLGIDEEMSNSEMKKTIKKMSLDNLHIKKWVQRLVETRFSSPIRMWS
eukprot:NODE_438_length_8605_cov_0.277334.p5 type:complete len:101 gc:universal NODE_438_length_8605_cov_0.277334:1607-1909(+)